MFTFAIARGVNRGWLQPVYGPVAQAGWRAVEQRIRPDGTLDAVELGLSCYCWHVFHNRTAVRFNPVSHRSVVQDTIELRARRDTKLREYLA